MKKLHIRMQGIIDLNTFVNRARDVKGDVLVSRGKFCIDGKSILGMYSLDVTQGCTVEFPDDAIEFEEFLQQFVGE